MAFTEDEQKFNHNARALHSLKYFVYQHFKQLGLPIPYPKIEDPRRHLFDLMLELIEQQDRRLPNIDLDKVGKELCLYVAILQAFEKKVAEVRAEL